MALQNYRELIVWQRAIQLVMKVYELTKDLPADERYGIKQQIQKAAVSVPANIAEGYGRTHRGDYLRFLSIANGSLCEVETYIVIFNELKYFTTERTSEVWGLCQEVGKMLSKRWILFLNPERCTLYPTI